MSSVKAALSRSFANIIAKRIYRWANNPIVTQNKVFKHLISKAKHTKFGKDHNFDTIKTHQDFTVNVPVRDYEDLKPYVEQIIAGEKDVLWDGKPIYFAKTSGTTSGVKYIPITKDSMPMHVNAARNAILLYINETGKTAFVNGKMIFLQGSPTLEEKNGIKIGRLSGIVANHVPLYLQKNRMPSFKTNCIEDWETKVNTIVEETLEEDMTVISGIPSWVQMYFERLSEKTNQKIGQVFSNFNLFIYGGVNYQPYKTKFENLIGKKIDSIELYPASEGFFAFQDKQNQNGMLLQLNSGIFYEFIEQKEFSKANPSRITIKDVELGVNYVMLISTNAGLWGYNLGDIVAFTSLKPYRLIVTGRIKHYISAFGEHVIGKEIENALKQAIEGTTIAINEFTVAPEVNPKNGLPYHEWFIEFYNEPEDFDILALKMDQLMQDQNSYYKDLIQGKILQNLKITKIKSSGFQNYMKSIGKLGGQNKVPRLSNNREIAEKLKQLNLIKT